MESPIQQGAGERRVKVVAVEKTANVKKHYEGLSVANHQPILCEGRKPENGGGVKKRRGKKNRWTPVRSSIRTTIKHGRRGFLKDRVSARGLSTPVIHRILR